MTDFEGGKVKKRKKFALVEERDFAPPNLSARKLFQHFWSLVKIPEENGKIGTTFQPQ